MRVTRNRNAWSRATLTWWLWIAVLPAGLPARDAVAAELIPSIGITRSIRDGDGTVHVYRGLAVRGALLPAVQAEIGIAYRGEKRLGGSLEERMWPVTASLWLRPLPSLYAGGGVGWYHTTLDYAEGVPVPDETRQEFGTHLGGGLEIPLAPHVAIDLNGRYVFLESQPSGFPPRDLDPDFWSTTIGLALGF